MHTSDVIFTSGATEANNLAITGLSTGHVNRIFVGATEHKSVLQPCSILGENGHTVIVIPVHNNGVRPVAPYTAFIIYPSVAFLMA